MALLGRKHVDWPSWPGVLLGVFWSCPAWAQEFEVESSTTGVDPLGSADTAGLIQSFIEMAAVLGFVCLLAYLLLGKLLPRFLKVPEATASGRLLKVVDRLALDPKRAILVVAMGEQHFLIGSSDQGLHWLARLDGSEVRDAMAAAAAAPGVWSRPAWFGPKKEAPGDDSI